MTLPFVDEHSRQVRAPPERVWQALIATMRGQFDGREAAVAARLLGCAPAAGSGDFGRPVVRRDQAIPGFAVAEADAPRRLALRGRHRFSRYALTFVLDDGPGHATLLRARTHAAFPGLAGRAYRAAVIGSGGHRLLMRRLLAAIERAAVTSSIPNC